MSESVHTTPAPKTPVHLWVVGGISLLWHLVGVFDYLATHLELDFYMSNFTEEQLEFFYGFPAWAVAGWALGVWMALAGSVGLLLRRRWAVWCFLISLLGMAVSSFYSMGLSEGVKIMGTGGVIFSFIIWIVAIALLIYSKKMADRGNLT